MGGRVGKVLLPLVALAGVGIATGGFGLAGAGAAGSAAAGAGAASTAASSGGFFGSLFTKLASNPLGLLSSGLNAFSSARSASAQQAVLALQEQSLVLAGARDRLGIATRLNRSQGNLGRALASIAVSPFGGAQQAQLATAASSQAARESGLLAAEQSLAVQSGASRIAQLRARRRGTVRPGEVAARQFLSFGGGLFESVG